MKFRSQIPNFNTFSALFSVALIPLLVRCTYAQDCMSTEISLEESCLCRLKGEKTAISDACPATTCVNGDLTYNQTEDRLKCTCYKNFEGIQCDLIYCKYGHRINKKSCDCESGFTGHNCELMDCQNGGKSIIANGWTKCDCVDGYAGKRCEIKVPDCGDKGKVVWVETSDFVKEKLIKVDPDKKLMCHCEHGYGGELCEEKLTCKNGKLMDTGCICDHHWTGEFCEIPVCEHGSLVINSCVCEFGWGGKFCDSCLWGYKEGDKCQQFAVSTPMREEIKSGTPHFKMSWPLFIVILVVCSVAFLAVGCWFQPRRHLGYCCPSLKYSNPNENPENQNAVTPRVVVVQDGTGGSQIVVNVVPKKNNGDTSSRDENLNDSRKNSTHSKPPSYTKLASEEPKGGGEETARDEVLPTYRDAMSYRQAIKRAQNDNSSLVIQFIDE